MPQAIVPWENSVFPEEIIQELDRRKVNRGMNYVDASSGDWASDSGDWVTYRGPMTSWVRFCSNGAGKANPYAGDEFYDKQGFVLFGGKDFYSSYGFLNPSEFGYGTSNPAIIGYMPNGMPHIIDNDIQTSNYPIHVPPPEIESISVNIQKELYRRARINWICFSPKQLEYMTPYFLVPGISCILEWGWNHFDTTSLIDLTDVSGLIQLRKNPYPLYTRHILSSKGNYDLLFGRVTHFEWSMEGNKIRCTTEITSPDRLYSGLVVDEMVVTKKDNGELGILNSLGTFVNESLPNIKSVLNEELSDDLTGIKNFRDYLKEEYPESKYGERWKEILYGVFYGRDFSSTLTFTSTKNIPKNLFTTGDPYVGGSTGDPYSAAPSTQDSQDLETFNSLDYDNKRYDFDRVDQEDVWISMDMLVEILNFHYSRLEEFDNSSMFKIDISDCVIGGHPNLISTDGGICLIPNAYAPKYFNGLYGYAPEKNDEEYSILHNADTIRKFTDNTIDNNLADYRLYKTCLPLNSEIYRDNLDRIINMNRYGRLVSDNSYAFPFIIDHHIDLKDSPAYPAHYTGHLKNIYFNTKKFKDIVEDSKTYVEVLKKVLDSISNTCANYWDFRIVNGTGNAVLKDSDAATIKVVDNKFMLSVNYGKVYSFDYFDADSLLKEIKFTPTLSDSAAIRTIYAETNNPERKTNLSGHNELLDYHFKDRLFLEKSETQSSDNNKNNTNAFESSMTKLQGLVPEKGSLQITSKKPNGEIIVKRLVLPNLDILKLLLDDNDVENNQKYTGIMPGIQAQFVMDGVGGLRTFMMFLVRNLPEPYSHENIVFRIINLEEKVEAGRWSTVITAGIIPLRGEIKKRLGII